VLKIAEVLVFRGVGQLYTYLIPEDKASQLTVGTPVKIPFGRAETHGIIMNIAAFSSSKVKNLKEISAPLEKIPSLSPQIIAFLLWFKEYYQLTPYKAYQTIMGSNKLRLLKEEEHKFSKKEKTHQLTKEQKEIITTILKSKGAASFLLFGVTSSGKTEIYLQIAQEILNIGKTVLILLPEIALTPQMTKIFQERFGTGVAVIHSGLTPKQREIAWNKVYQEKAQIVLGPRSAIFSPLKNIGLIVVDEEHETTYKQDSHPRYYTHTVAQYLSKQNKAKLIFGSATPGIELFNTTENKELKLLKLAKRVLNRPLPEVEIIDMRAELLNGNKSMFSHKMSQYIKEALAKQEKVMLLVNRRGYAPYIICQKCGTIYTCPECNLSFTYHKDKKLRCHRCNVVQDVTNKCPKCKINSLAFSGVGIQKVEAELHKQFPGSHIMRLDRDTAKNAKHLEEILNEFEDKGDILLGTQIIAKGHHFEAVTFVGVLGIDTILNIPDFRACERTFQLLTQVAGRAGRGHKRGRVIVQTCQPEHYAIQHAKTHAYENFYRQEISYRKELSYPPFSSLLNIIISSKNESDIKRYCTQIMKYLEPELQLYESEDRPQIIGPKPAPVERLKTYYRWHILIKCKKSQENKLKEIIKHLPEAKSSVRLIIDFEPRSVL
jgi:primosomal protein N' (replication factor Y) (superfamily II helicase)